MDSIRLRVFDRELHPEELRRLLDELMLLSNDNIGKCKLYLYLKSENGGVQKIRSNKLKVNTKIEFINKIRELFGKKNVWIN